MDALRLQWRPLWPGELDHEKLWLTVSATTAAAGVFALRGGLRFPPCAFHFLTGLPCPGCGSTRAVVQVLAGHWTQAWLFNPLTTGMILGVVAFDLYAVAVLAFHLPRLRPASISPRARLGIRLGAVAAIGTNWAWVLAHGL